MNTMPHVIRFTKKMYRKMMPASIRQSRWITKLKQSLLWHQMMYDLDYYDSQVEGPSSRSAPTISESIYTEFFPKRVVDVGCGTVALLEKLRDRGCEVLGLDYSEAALLFCRVRHLNVLKFDLGKEVFTDTSRFDVAISLEVAEHLPAEVADRYVDLLTRLSSVIIFSAARPGWGGMDHVNKQPPSYWITKFKRRGFEHEETLSKRWSEQWKASGTVASYYYKHLMIFIHFSARQQASVHYLTKHAETFTALLTRDHQPAALTAAGLVVPEIRNHYLIHRNTMKLKRKYQSSM